MPWLNSWPCSMLARDIFIQSTQIPYSSSILFLQISLCSVLSLSSYPAFHFQIRPQHPSGEAMFCPLQAVNTKDSAATGTWLDLPIKLTSPYTEGAIEPTLGPSEPSLKYLLGISGKDLHLLNSWTWVCWWSSCHHKNKDKVEGNGGRYHQLITSSKIC